jgi:NADH-quinone oxidoreductase subunit N
MAIGNISAIAQTNLKRMLAYSTISHMGFLLLGFLAGSENGYSSAMFYVLAYSLPSLGIMLMAAEEGPSLDDFAGLSRRRMGAAWLMVLMLVSLVGIPPLAGFFGKLYLFLASVASGLVVWVVLAVVMSVVSAGYYLRIVRSSFLAEGGAEKTGANPWPAAWAVGVCAVLTIVLGVFAGPVLAWMGTLAT